MGKLLGVGVTVAGRKIGALFGGIKYDFIMPAPSVTQLENLNKWLSEGKIKCITDKIVPFDNIHEAYERQHTARAVGKIILLIKDDAE